jgi:aspartate-semialdehyde dehydrogenase
MFLEMEHAVDKERVAQTLAGDHVTLAGAEDDSQPSNVNTAGQANILVSLKSEAAQPNGIWLWAAADNLRIAAMTAVECAESMIATRPLGKIQ